MAVFVPNPAGIAAIGASPFMLEFMEYGAEQVEVRVRDLMPVLTGEAQASVHSGSAIEAGLATGRVWSDDDKMPYLEFGTEDTPEFQPFRRGLEGWRI